MNAVLRRVAQEGYGAAGGLEAKGSSLRRLASWESHPEWLLRRWIRASGRRACLSRAQAGNRESRAYLQPLDGRLEQAVEKLNEDGVPARALKGIARAALIPKGVDLRRALESVPGVIQDPAASMVVRYADPSPGVVAVDLCAAPGGKAALLSRRADFVLALDISSRRLARLQETAERLRLMGRLACARSDARAPPVARADFVLLDAPCTGTGTLARRPDIRWRLRESDIFSLAALQRELLASAAAAVRPGGILLYSTCSLEPEENAAQVDWFLGRFSEFELSPGDAPRRCLDSRGCLMMDPGIHGFDGAFAARMRRRRR